MWNSPYSAMAGGRGTAPNRQPLKASTLATKLTRYLELDEKERRRLAEFESGAECVASGVDILRENQPYRDAGVLIEGWCLKYKLLVDGRRQVINYVLPGSFIALEANVFDTADHSIGTLTPCSLAWFDPQEMTRTFSELPRLAAAIVWDTAREDALLMERLTSLGRRSAYERLAHVLVEVAHLLACRGLPLEKNTVLPLSQAVIADTLGLSQVHVNRTIRQLRDDGLIEATPQRGIVLRDLRGLIEICGYDETYLHRHLMPAKTHKSFRG